MGSKTKPCCWIFCPSTLTLSAVVCPILEEHTVPAHIFHWTITAISGGCCRRVTVCRPPSEPLQALATLMEFLQVCSFLGAIPDARQRCASSTVPPFLTHLREGHYSARDSSNDQIYSSVKFIPRSPRNTPPKQVT